VEQTSVVRGRDPTSGKVGWSGRLRRFGRRREDRRGTQSGARGMGRGRRRSRRCRRSRRHFVIRSDHRCHPPRDGDRSRAGLLAYRLRAVGTRPVPARWVAVGFGQERRHGRLHGRMNRRARVVVQVDRRVHAVRAQTISTSTEVTGESRTVDATGEWASPHLTSARKSSGATLAAAILTRRRMVVNAAETLSPRPSIPR